MSTYFCFCSESSDIFGFQILDSCLNVTHLKKFMKTIMQFSPIRKPTFCICKNQDADQLGDNCAADQRLCFRCLDSTIPLLPKSGLVVRTSASRAVDHGFAPRLRHTKGVKMVLVAPLLTLALKGRARR